MKIGLNLPSHIPGTSGATLLEWARRAEAGPFSSVAASDRLAYSNYDPLIVLSAAAAVTTRVRLVTNVLLATIRNPAILAKEAASLDAFSNGRLSLGVGVGFRPDDYLPPMDFHDRGKRFDAQLELMRRIWSGAPLSNSGTPSFPGKGQGLGVSIGPAPARKGGPELLIGAGNEQTIDRVGRWADGFFAPPAKPETTAQLVAFAKKSWAKHNRPGTPRCVAMAYFSLGPNADKVAEDYQFHYWGFDKTIAIRSLKGTLTTPQAIRDRIHGLEAVGIDEFILLPSSAELDQLDRVQEVVS